MNAKQLQYAIELAKVCNFSKVSEKLNISQPALSKQIILLEKELGVKLFDRNSVPMQLTAAGDYFIRRAQDLLYREDQLKRSMESFRTEKRGRLTIGISPFRSVYLIPPMVKKMRERYPAVEIHICDTDSKQNRQDVADGKLDLAIVNLPVDDPALEYIPLEPDVLVLAVPNTLLEKLTITTLHKSTAIDFKECAALPFVVVDPTKEMRRLFESLCSETDAHPPIAMEVTGLTAAWAMARAGIGAALLPLQFVNGDELDNADITLFTIKNNTFRRQPAIVTRRGQYLSEYAQYAISLLKNE